MVEAVHMVWSDKEQSTAAHECKGTSCFSPIVLGVQRMSFTFST